MGGQIINLLAYIPSLEISTEEETSFGNGAWRRNSRPAVGNSVVFFVNHDLNIGVVGEQTDGEPLDTALIEGVVNSVALVTRQNTAWSKSFRSSPSKVLTLPFEDDQVYLVQGWKYNWDPNKNHGGIDYKKGKPGEWLAFDVVAAYDGGLHCEWDNSYGNVCYVKHGAEQSVFYTVYAHLESTVKSSGDVKQGEKIGVAGKTGADSNDLLHLHFEIQVDEPCNQMFCRTDPYAIDKTFDYYPGGAKFSGLGAGHWWVKDPPILPGPQMGCTQEVAHDCRDQGLSGLCVGSDIPNTFECVGDFNGGSDKDDVVLVVTGEEQSDAGLFQNETDGDLFLVKHDTKEFLFTATPDFWEDIQLEIYDNEGNFEGLVDVFGVGEKEGFIWDSKGVSGVVFVVVRNGGTPVGNYTYTWGSM